MNDKSDIIMYIIIIICIKKQKRKERKKRKIIQERNREGNPQQHIRGYFNSVAHDYDNAL
jgi:hypothetical protein